jgi:hypothetical protein
VDLSLEVPGWWGVHRPTPTPRSIVELIRLGALDSELAALLWLLLEARVPLVVAAGETMAGKTTILTALLEFLSPATRRIVLRGLAEDFAWLPEADRLGRRRIAGSEPVAAVAVTPSDPRATVMLAAELSQDLPLYTWGEQARTAVRALGLGYGLATTMRAATLEEVFDALSAPPLSLSSDELSYFGVVLIVRDLRVVAAHYVRPLVRDVHGHLRRQPPAVLATWDPGRAAFEHFAWGILVDLAGRSGLRPGDFEAEHARRADFLASLGEIGVVKPADVRAALLAYRVGGTGDGLHRH